MSSTLIDRLHKTGHYALAGLAYARGEVRLVSRDLSDCDHLVATRQGLFALERQRIGERQEAGNGLRLIAHGLFYGMTIVGDAIHLFEAGDRPHHPTCRGRIVRLTRAGETIVAAGVIATGLDNGCHQIDMVRGALHVLDTYNQRLLVLAPDGTTRQVVEPLPMAADGAGYAHINSLLQVGDHVLLLLHNGGRGADADASRPSEVATFDADWRLVDRRPLAGHGCHSFASLEDGTLLSCGSLAGELIGSDGTRVWLGDMMTRGLSVDGDRILVGGSTFGRREIRDAQAGAVHILDRAYRRLATVTVPAPVTDIRRIDGRDRSLSSHLAACATAEPVT